MIEVVGAVIIRRDARQARVLLTQRTPDRDYPWHWESPGGKVEGNESHHQALTRELREEIGVELHPDLIAQTPIWCGTFERDGDEPAFVALYRAYLQPTDRPKPLEGQGLGWFGRTCLAQLMLTPGNRAARTYVDRALQYAFDMQVGDMPSWWHDPERLTRKA